MKYKQSRSQEFSLGRLTGGFSLPYSLSFSSPFHIPPVTTPSILFFLPTGGEEELNQAKRGAQAHVAP